jgi:hypothetical protein
MRVWAICVVVLFGAAELYQWIEGLTLPLPVLIGAGALLAIVSNSRGGFGLLGAINRTLPEPALTESAEPCNSKPAATATATSYAPSSHYHAGPQLPKLTPQSPRSISFEIRSPKFEAKD